MNLREMRYLKNTFLLQLVLKTLAKYLLEHFLLKQEVQAYKALLQTQMTQTDHRILALKIPEVFVAFHYQLE